MSGRRQSNRGAEELFGDEDDAEKLDEPLSTFQFIRDYETIKIETDVPNEFLLTLDDGTKGHGGRGAFYKNIERKYVLKKKRQNVSLPSFNTTTSFGDIACANAFRTPTLATSSEMRSIQINGTSSD